MSPLLLAQDAKAPIKCEAQIIREQEIHDLIRSTISDWEAKHGLWINSVKYSKSSHSEHLTVECCISLGKL